MLKKLFSKEHQKIKIYIKLWVLSFDEKWNILKGFAIQFLRAQTSYFWRVLPSLYLVRYTTKL